MSLVCDLSTYHVSLSHYIYQVFIIIIVVHVPNALAYLYNNLLLMYDNRICNKRVIELYIRIYAHVNTCHVHVFMLNIIAGSCSITDLRGREQLARA